MHNVQRYSQSYQRRPLALMTVRVPQRVLPHGVTPPSPYCPSAHEHLFVRAGVQHLRTGVRVTTNARIKGTGAIAGESGTRCGAHTNLVHCCLTARPACDFCSRHLLSSKVFTPRYIFGILELLETNMLVCLVMSLAHCSCSQL